MAEGLLAKQLPDALKPVVSVSSAGTHGLFGNPAEPSAVRAAAAYGADISRHRARALDARIIRSADLVLGMEQYHLDYVNSLLIFRCKYARLLGAFDRKMQDDALEIDDPYGLSFSAYEAAAGEIQACIPGVIDYISGQLDLKAS